MTQYDNDFSFKVETLPKGEAITYEEAEEYLLNKLEESNGTCKQTLWQLVRTYRLMEKQDDALNCIYRLLKLSDDTEENASFFLSLGQITEQKGNYPAAIECYRGAFYLKPSTTEVWYLINNNLGFCLNTLKRYDEAEGYLSAAIKIDPTRANAYKNLGLCFMGRGDYISAVGYFINSTKVNASDPRSLRHLEELLSDHPELLEESPNLSETLVKCRKAVEVALACQPDFEGHWEKLRNQKSGIVDSRSKSN
ncbi:tetratricopeptide repeat protein [Thermodesulfobacteriota bacterium]